MKRSPVRPKHAVAQTVSLFAVTVAALAGCTVDGHAVNDADPAANASVDLKSLDTGKYPTAPRPQFGKAGKDDIIPFETQRMTQYIVAPFEVDPDMTAMGRPTQVMWAGSGNLKTVLDDQVAGVKGNDEVIYGYVVSASTPDETIRTGDRREMNHFVARYPTPAAASTAVKQMSDEYAKEPGVTEVHPAGMSESRVFSKPSWKEGFSGTASFTAHGVYGIYTYYMATDAHKDQIEPAIRKATSLQVPLIDKFPASPTNDEVAAGTRPKQNLIMDQNHILIYALPYSDDEIKNHQYDATNQGNIRAVYGPRGMSFRSTDPAEDFALLTEVGSTANAVEKTTVYRASTPEGATKIMNTFQNQNRSRGMKPLAAPPNLPVARCLTKATDGVTAYWCAVQVGRYFADLSGTDLKDVYQQTSAQYVILTKADQKAN